MAVPRPLLPNQHQNSNYSSALVHPFGTGILQAYALFPNTTKERQRSDYVSSSWSSTKPPELCDPVMTRPGLSSLSSAHNFWLHKVTLALDQLDSHTSNAFGRSLKVNLYKRFVTLHYITFITWQEFTAINEHDANKSEMRWQYAKKKKVNCGKLS